MNFQQWPASQKITPINTNANTEGEIRQVYAAVQELISQFNQLTALQGGLQDQILSILGQLGNLRPYDGTNDLGYVSNAVLKDWPNANLTVKSTINSVLTTLIDVVIDDTTPSISLAAAAGPLNILAGGAYLDANHDYGVEVNGGDLKLLSAGDVTSDSAMQASGYKSSDGYDGATATTGGVVFKNGLYISGTIDPSAEVGYVEDVPYDTTPYVRFNDTAAGSGEWQPLYTYFPDLAADTPWGGSTDLITLGTIATGEWQGTPIADAYLVETYLQEGWTGSTDIVTLGAVATCASLTSQGLIKANHFMGSYIQAASDSELGFRIINHGTGGAGDFAVLTCDTRPGIESTTIYYLKGTKIEVTETVTANNFYGAYIQPPVDGPDAFRIINHGTGGVGTFAEMSFNTTTHEVRIGNSLVVGTPGLGGSGTITALSLEVTNSVTAVDVTASGTITAATANVSGTLTVATINASGTATVDTLRADYLYSSQLRVPALGDGDYSLALCSSGGTAILALNTTAGQFGVHIPGKLDVGTALIIPLVS